MSSIHISSHHLEGENILATGGAGFILTNFLERHVDNNVITIYDNFSRDAFSFSKLRNHPNVHVVKDSVTNLHSLEKLDSHSIVIHAASLAGIANVQVDSINTMNVNLFGTSNILNVVHKWPNLKKFVYFSTSEVYGKYAYKVEENHPMSIGEPLEPRWTYAASKLAGENLAFGYFRKYKLPLINLRPFNVYGPGQVGEGALIKFIYQALANEPITISGDGSQIRAWCFIDDFVDALTFSASHPNLVGETFNIGNPGQAVSISQLAHLVVSILNSKSEILYSNSSAQDIQIRIPNIDKAKALLNYTPRVDLGTGILRTAEWCQFNRLNEEGFNFRQ